MNSPGWFVNIRQPAILVSLLMVACGLTLLPIAGMNGWPINHDAYFLDRTKIYALHILQGDLFPVWSSVDNSGFGSPQPALYHKLFYLISGWALVFTESLTDAIFLSLLLWLTVGSLGMYRLCRTIGCGEMTSFCGGILLVVANYTVTNWLVRGAMAELAAAMLMPWLLSEFIRSLQFAKFGLRFCVILVLVFLSHSALCYAVALILGLCALLMVIHGRLSVRIFSPISLATLLVLAGILLGPYLMAMAYFAADYDMSRITPPVYRPENQLQPFGRYFWDSDWYWGQSFYGNLMQLDFAAMMLLALALIAAVWRKVFCQDCSVRDNSCVALFLIAGIGLALQTILAIPYYRFFPGAVYIQFPWRLLALITPVLIALALLLARKQFSEKLAKGFSVIAVVISIFLCGAFVPIQYGEVARVDPSLENVTFSAFGEYVPRLAVASIGKEDLFRSYQEQGCLLSESSGQVESLTRSFVINCKRATLLALPLYSSAAHRLTVQGVAGSCLTHRDFPGFCSISLPEGAAYITVELPTLRSVFASLLKI